MAFAGGLGANVRLADVPRDASIDSRTPEGDVAGLFSESASRFLIEVTSNHRAAFESIFQNAKVPFGCIGAVTDDGRLRIGGATGTAIDAPIAELKEAWQKPLRW
jgi:phosphoribosylformylglycinamidine synthase